MSAPAEVRRCPKCQTGRIVGSYDELSCINCGFEPPVTNGALPGMLQIMSSEGLGRAAIDALRRLQVKLREVEEEREGILAEARRFVKIAEFCDVELTPGLQETFGVRPKQSRASSRQRALAPPAEPCSYCGRDDFRDIRGLKAHVRMHERHGDVA